jgi:methylated-DNA-[protein]-cysteine S-methyltransferase
MNHAISTTFASPIGPLTLTGDDLCVRGLRFDGQGPLGTGAPGAIGDARAQLQQYFAGERTEFTLSLRVSGTDFQLWVWEQLQLIPYGETTTYGELARLHDQARGRPGTSPRAVGSVVARTPVPIVIPCHRVIGSDGSLTGYGGGIPRKRALLAFEASHGTRAALDAGLAVAPQLQLL